VERARLFALSADGRWEESVREHRQVLAALKARDAEHAGRLLAHHVRRTGEIVADTLTQKKATP
jgi:DNA-binding GntR family transcriptional regulator